MEDAGAAPAVHGTKGVHLLVPRDRLGIAGAVTLLHPADARVVFALPAGAYAVLGTTDTRTDVPPDQVRPNTSDVQYLLDAANRFFPSAKLTERDVVSAWAGIRPLIASSRASATPADQSREHEIVVGPGGVIAVSGGKLTTYRAMAEEIVDVVAERLHRAGARSDTAHAVLPGGDVADVQAEIGAASDMCGDVGLATHLVHWHGSGWRAVWALGETAPHLRERVVPTSDVIRAEMLNAVRYEHARTLADLLVRRTHVAFESRDHGLSAASDVAALIAPVFGWDTAQRDAAVAEYRSEVQRLFTIDAG
jgi:glycerol-3-phosphate dehydrogenase